MHTIEGITGLNADQVKQARAQYGWNKLERRKSAPLLKRVLQEPMLMLLVLASAIYFTRGAYAEGIFMLVAIVTVSFISFYQESRSKAALDALQAYTRPQASVIRNAAVMHVPTEELVVGDYFIVEEGELIPADGVIERSNDLSVNEAILTGESMSVQKKPTDTLYQGTLVISGLAVCKTTAVGMQTQMGRIGRELQEMKEAPSPLQVQIKDFVRNMAIVGMVVFFVVWSLYFFKSLQLMQSLLKALTLAMSILPEEIPVAFSTFMALGAWRLAQVGVIVKNIHTVETLGSATVICVDKTGTLTKNEMELISVYDVDAEMIYGREDFASARSIIATAMWASEPLPFDPMEVAIHRAYAATHPVDARTGATMVHEYPLGGTPPIMTHVFEDQTGVRIIAAKGAPEAFLRRSNLPPQKLQALNDAFHALAGKGFRVLAVAEAVWHGPELPTGQQEFEFLLKGLVAFYDPPKENIPFVLESFYAAGIQVKLLTGDNTMTAETIARQVNLKNTTSAMTGEQLVALTDTALQNAVENVTLFTRMFPEAKLKVIEALKKRHHVVAMTGDGVNDAPALKAAHIGIAMGRKGSEVARQASALILSNDDLGAMVAAVTMGRKIYSNLKKAIRYIISIHIPIVLIVLLPLLLGWPYAEVFTPVHVIFLELIMGPTCSIVYEHEPVERNVMTEKPRPFRKTFFRIHELAISIVQGLAVAAGLLVSYWYAVLQDGSPAHATAMVFVTLVTANLLLTLVNRSFSYSIFTTLTYKNRLIPLTLAVTGGLSILLFAIPAARRFFHFELLSWHQLGTCVATGILSVIWFEAYKWFKRHKV